MANYNPKWPYILYQPYRILTIGDSGSGKPKYKLNNLNLKKHQQTDIEKIYFFGKDPF